MRLPAVHGIIAPKNFWPVTPHENNSVDARASRIYHEADSLVTKSLQAFTSNIDYDTCSHDAKSLQGLISKLDHETGSLETKSLRFLISFSFGPGTSGWGEGLEPPQVRL